MEKEDQIIQKLVEHESQLELISAKLLEHDQKFDRLMDGIDGLTKICKATQEDLAFANSRMNRLQETDERLEADAQKIKLQLKMA